MCVIPSEVLLFSQLFGAFPLKYTVTLEGSTSITFSPKVFVWGLIMIVVQSLFSYGALYVDHTLKLAGKPIRMTNNIATMAVVLDVVTLNMMAVVTFISSVRKYPKFINMCSNLEKVDQNLRETLQEPKFIVKIFFVFAVVITLLTLSLTLESYTFLLTHEYNSFLFYVPFLTTYFAQAAVFIHFTHICHTINTRFRMINERIKQEVIKQSFGQLLGMQCLLEVEICRGGPSAVGRIRALIDLYWLLCEAVYQANAFYSSQLLVAIFSSFIHIIITLYYFFLHLWPSIELDEVPYLFMQVMWIITHLSHLVLLVSSSTAVTDVADETAPMVCKLINRDLDPEIRKQLEIFLVQLLHHNTRFSALGFFQIRSHILTSIAGSVTTYLVILIQFQSFSSPQVPPALAVADTAATSPP